MGVEESNRVPSRILEFHQNVLSLPDFVPCEAGSSTLFLHLVAIIEHCLLPRDLIFAAPSP